MAYSGSKTVLLEADSCQPKGNSGYSTGSQGYTVSAPSLNPNLLTNTARFCPMTTQTRDWSTTTQTRDRPTATTQTRKPPTISQTRDRPTTTTQTRKPPTISQTRDRPTTTTQTRKPPTISQTRDRPTTTTQTRKPPTISQTRDRPSTTQTRDRPSTIQTRDRLTTTQTRDRPTTTQTRDRPTTTQTRDRPTTTQTRDRPTTTQTRDRPTTTQTRDRPTTTQTRKPETIWHSSTMFEALQFESEAVSQNRSGDGAWSSSLLKVPVLIPKTRAVRVTTLLQTQDPDTVFSSLRRHNPELRKWTSRQFPGSAFEYALKNANFEKLHQEFSEVFRLKKLITLGDSVCALYVGDICQGSGFMLAGDFIMTNAHLLENALLEDGKTLAVSVKALFNHENNLIESEVLLMYEAYSGVIDLDKEMDYAVLRLKRGAKPMPPGLLPYFGPKPNAGGACIIGHPGDQVKKIDLTYIIGKKEREAAANQHLEPYDESARMIIVKEAVESGINEIWSSEEVITYNTVCMFHGSSGSPLMDANGRVVGIHSAGFVYEYEGLKHSVIEYAHPTLQIFARFLSNVGPLDIESARDVGQLSSTNPYLRDVILEYLIL